VSGPIVWRKLCVGRTFPTTKQDYEGMDAGELSFGLSALDVKLSLIAKPCQDGRRRGALKILSQSESV
jgi:hypothetical protein